MRLNRNSSISDDTERMVDNERPGPGPSALLAAIDRDVTPCLTWRHAESPYDVFIGMRRVCSASCRDTPNIDVATCQLTQSLARRSAVADADHGRI